MVPGPPGGVFLPQMTTDEGPAACETVVAGSYVLRDPTFSFFRRAVHPEPVVATAVEVLPDNGHAGALPGFSLRTAAWALLLSLAGLGVIAYFTFDPAAFARIPQQLNGWCLAAALATVGVRLVFGGWRLDYFTGGRLGLWGGLRGQLAWDFCAYVSPSTVGGGPFAAAFVARDRGVPLGEATSIVLFAVLLDQIWFALTIPGLLFVSRYVEVIPSVAGAVGFWSFMLFFVGFLVWVLVFAYGTLVRPELLERLVDRVFRLRVLRRFRERARTVMVDVRRRSVLLRRQPAGFFARGFALTIVPWLCRYLLALFLIWSVHPGLDPVLVLVRTMALNLGAIALPTPGGAGGLEGFYVLFLGPPVMPETLVAPTLLAWRFLGYYLFILLGGLLMMQQVHRALRRKPLPRPTVAVPVPVDEAG